MSQTITAEELGTRLRSSESIELIDVRTPAEFREVHLETARNVPLDQFDPHQVAQQNGQKPVYLICKSGARSQQALQRLVQAGYAQAFSVEGGTAACERAGLPVVRGQKCMSLERQVRIAAGSIVLTGVLLAWFVHPYLIGLSAFVGAGLIFSGITDTCGMGVILMKMPWNR
ncbi:MAG TPA: rhodanese-like domain-containing protein [Caulifigura sp.]|jgi:rhodanese-related sulfurtransferase|nr:rhodanese-like domain-containing protein [Caulifigura sp.]